MKFYQIKPKREKKIMYKLIGMESKFNLWKSTLEGAMFQ